VTSQRFLNVVIAIQKTKQTTVHDQRRGRLQISGWQLLLPADRILFVIGVIADV
jgi:hypothetical protein